MPVMLVDDTDDVRDALAVLLEREGYAVHAFGDAASALAALRGGLLPSLILLDLSMPAMDGYEFRRQQLADAVLASIPVVVFSGISQSTADLARLGSVSFITKPVDPSILLTIIRAHRIPRQRVSGDGS
jgi:putative two-component system response regulator